MFLLCTRYDKFNEGIDLGIQQFSENLFIFARPSILPDHLSRTQDLTLLKVDLHRNNVFDFNHDGNCHRQYGIS